LYPVAGDCVIDAINNVGVAAAPIKLATGLLRVRGWAMASGKDGSASDRVSIALVAPGGSTQLFPANRVSRPDVAAHFHNQDAGNAGFEAIIDVSRFSGTFDLKVVQKVGAKSFVCGQQAARLVK
jgi:hypothetical protein